MSLISGENGGRVTTAPRPATQKPASAPAKAAPAAFNQALKAAKTASDKVTSKADAKGISAAEEKWNTVGEQEKHEYRRAAEAPDSSKAISDLDAQYKAMFRGNGQQTKYFDWLTGEAKRQALAETPAQRKFYIDLHDKSAKVQAASEKLDKAPEKQKPAAYEELSGAVKDMLNFQLGHELSAMAPGPGGSHTLQQWQQAAKSLKDLNGIKGDEPTMVDDIATTNGYLDQILHNPDSLKLTPAEQELAKTDPATLAFVKAAGVKLDDPKLSPAMRDLAKKDPVAFTMLSKAGAEIQLNDAPLIANTTVGQLADGSFLHVTVKGKPVLDQATLTRLGKLHDTTTHDSRLAALASGVLANLDLGGDPRMETLTLASDNARSKYAAERFKELTTGPDADPKAAMSFLNTQLNGFFNTEPRQALWDATGKTTFTEKFFTDQFNDLKNKPDPMSSDPEDIRDAASVETAADKAGRLAQDYLKQAPAEMKNVIRHALMNSFDKNSSKSNQHDSSGANSRFEEFFKALSMSVEPSAGAMMDEAAMEKAAKDAKEVTDWLMQRDAVQGGILTDLWSPSGLRFEGVKDTIEQGYGTTLSQTLLARVNGNADFSNMAYDLDMRVGQAIQTFESKHQEKIFEQDYRKFMDDKDKVLIPFFKSFQNDKNIGREGVKIVSDAQLRNIIGKTLGLAPTNTEAAEAMDYSKEWYDEGTYERNVIDSAVDLTKSRWGDTPTLNAQPLQFASRSAGLPKGGLLIRDSGEVIDLGAIRTGVEENGGKKVKKGDINDGWHWDSFEQMQNDNVSYNGKVYALKNFRMDADNDGRITSADFEERDAAVTTKWEHTKNGAMMAVGAAGAVLMFVPGGQAAGFALMGASGVLGALNSGNEIRKTWQHGGNWKPSNDRLSIHWQNLALTGLTFGRYGMLSGANVGAFRQAAGSVMGMGATTLGVTQAAQQGAFLYNNWNNKDISTAEKSMSLVMLGSSLAMVRMAGAEVKPWRGLGYSPVTRYGPPKLASTWKTAREAVKEWRHDSSPVVGRVSAMWDKATTTFHGQVAKPAYDAWVAAGRPTDKWWKDAQAFYKKDIDAEAQRAHAGDNPKTRPQSWKDGNYIRDAEAQFGERIARKAYENWDDIGRPKDTLTRDFWTRSNAARRYRKEVVNAYQSWRAEHAFVDGLAKGYEANGHVKRATGAEEPWFVEARTHHQSDIDKVAQQLHALDHTPGKPAATDAKYRQPAEAVVAYRLWSDPAGHKRAAPPQTEIAARSWLKPWQKTQRAAPTGLTFKQWVKINAPGGPGLTRLTTHPKPASTAMGLPRHRDVTDDVVMWADSTQRVMQFKPFKTLSDWLVPQQLTRAQLDRLGAWATNRNIQELTTLSRWTKLTRGGIMRGTRLRAAQALSGERNFLQQKPTDIAIWQDAERAFRMRIGEKAYKDWQSTPDRVLGAENKYFGQANDTFRKQLAVDARSYNDSPSQMPKPLRWLARKGAARPVWDQRAQDQIAFNDKIGEAGRDWTADPVSVRSNVRHFNDALKDPDIKHLVQTKAQEEAGPGNTVTEAHIDAAQRHYAFTIAQVAYKGWAAAGKDVNARHGQKFTQAAAQQDKVKAADMAAYQAWADSKFRDGWHNAPWTLARRGLNKPERWEIVHDAGRWAKDLGQQSWGRLTDRGALFGTLGLRQWGTQASGAFKTTLRGYAVAYGATNVLGAVGWTGANYWMKEERVGPEIADPRAELDKFLADPEGYIEDNYENTLFGQPMSTWVPGDDKQWGMQANGHVMAYTDADGKTRYFRRVPEDLYEVIVKTATTTARPSALDTRADGQKAPTVFFQDGRLHAYQTLKLSGAGDFTYTDIDPLASDPATLPDEIKEQIGIRAYEQWMDGGREQGTPAALIWSRAEDGFGKTTGPAAYKAWADQKDAARPADKVWTEARSDLQPQIDDRAKAIWAQGGGGGNGPSDQQRQQAEKDLAGELSLKAYARWKAAGRDAATSGSHVWMQHEADFAAKIGAPAYDATWMARQSFGEPLRGAYDAWNKERKTDGADRYWQQAVTDLKPEIDAETARIEEEEGKRGDGQRSRAEAAFAEEIATRAYEYWHVAGRDPETAGAGVWTEHEARYTDYLTPAGKEAWNAREAFRKGLPPAYATWAVQRPTGGGNKAWDDAVNTLTPQIEAEADRAWRANGGGGSGPTQAHRRTAETNLADRISFQAYQNWKADGRKPQTAGADTWTQQETAYAGKYGNALFQDWIGDRLPGSAQPAAGQGRQDIWASAVKDWHGDGQPILQTVEIRAPFRTEGNVDATLPRSHEGDGPGSFRDRRTLALGPIEGWRMHVNTEALWNYRYSTPTATTVRLGGPSPTQPWGWDVRQQNTSFWSRLNLSIGTVEYNGAMVHDLSAGSRNGWSVMNSRLYLDTGNRDRVRVDVTGKWVHLRETGLVELGLGSDFLKVMRGDRTFNVNGYYELQFYPADFRSQLNWQSRSNSRFGTMVNKRGFQTGLPSLGVDPAFQVTWSDERLKIMGRDGITDLPGLQAPVR